MRKLQKPVVIFALAVLATLLWGSAAPVIKFGYRLLGYTSANLNNILTFAGERFLLAGLMLLVFFSIARKKPLLPKRGNWPMLLLLGFVQTFMQYVTDFIGLAYASGVSAAVLSGTGNLMSIFIACTVMRQEKPTLRKMAGCLLGLAGIIVMNVGGGKATFTFLGEGMLLISAVMSGLGNCMSRNCAQKEDAVTVTCWQLLTGGAILLVLGKAMGGRVDLSARLVVPVLVYLSLVSAVAFCLWTALMKVNPVSSVAVYGFLIPLFGVLTAAVLLGEWAQAASPKTLIALALICAGILTVTVSGRPSKEAAPRE